MKTKKAINRLGLILIFLFIFLTIYTSLYAAGYRINWHWPLNFNQILSKTGMLVIETSPRNVNLYLKKDNAGFLVSEEIKNSFQTPAKIQNLLPGEYKLVLEKENYWPITRNIEILPNQTTKLSGVSLFKKSLPLNIYRTKIKNNNTVINQQKDKLIFLDQGKVLNLENEEISEIKLDSKILNNNFALSNQTLYNLNDLDETFKLDIDYLNIEMSQDEEKIYYNTENKIAYLNLGTQEKNNLLKDGNFLNFIIRNQQIYTIEKNTNNYLLRTYNYSTQLRERSIIIPQGDYKFCQKNSNFLSLYDKKNRRLIIIDNELTLRNQKIINNVNRWKWFDNNLLWQSNNEIYKYNLNYSEKKLLLRLSQDITDFIWQNQENYLLYSTKTSINIVDFKEGQNDFIEILRAQNIGPLFIDNSQTILYFYAEIGNQSGIFKLLLH